MPGCVLHVSGDEFRVDAFLADSNLQPYQVHHRGDIGLRSRRFTDSGLSLDVSTADGNLDAEIPDAINFLSTHEAELQRLHDFPGVTDMRLDFGYYRQDVAAQFEYLPPDLLARAGSFASGLNSLFTQGLLHRPGNENRAAWWCAGGEARRRVARSLSRGTFLSLR